MSTTALAKHLDWPGAKQVIQVTRQRTIRRKTTTEIVYYITSLPREHADAAQLLELIRRHWGATENGLHWVRDEVFGEDRSTIFRDHSPQNWAALRNASLNWLRGQSLTQFTRTLRSFNRHPARLFAKMGLVN